MNNIPLGPYVSVLESKFSEFGVFVPLDTVDLMNIATTVVGDWHLCLNVAHRHGLKKNSRQALWEWLDGELNELARLREVHETG